MQTLKIHTGSRRRPSHRSEAPKDTIASSSSTTNNFPRSSSLLLRREEGPLTRSMSVASDNYSIEEGEDDIGKNSIPSPACRTPSNLSGSFISLPSSSFSSSTNSLPIVGKEFEEQKKRRRRHGSRFWSSSSTSMRTKRIRRRRSSVAENEERCVKFLILGIAAFGFLACFGTMRLMSLPSSSSSGNEKEVRGVDGAIRQASSSLDTSHELSPDNDIEINENKQVWAEEVNTNALQSNQEIQQPLPQKEKKDEIIPTNKEEETPNQEPSTKTSKHSKEENMSISFQTKTKSAPSCSTPLDPSDIKYTLVTQFSDNRLWMFPHHCERLPTDIPVSIAIYTDKTKEEILQEIFQPSPLSEAKCDEDFIRNYLTIQTLPTKGYSKGEYPVNKLRNMALSAVQTSHVMYIDIDFWESTNLFATLDSAYVKQELSNDAYLAIVIPAFQLMRQCKEYRDCPEHNIPKMPKTKEEVLKLVKKHQVFMFDPTNKGGHGSTRYGDWAGMQGEGDLLDLGCLESNRYEPYMAFRYCDDLPPFQEEFTGYGKNKMTWVMQMRRTGYTFSQLGGTFLVHYPHLDSASRLEWNKTPKKVQGHTPKKVHDVDWNKYKRGKNDAIFVQFREWLERDVEDRSKIFLCENALDDDAKLWVDRL